MKRLILLLISVGIIPTVLWAGIYGTLTGKVTDEQGKPLPGATVMLEGTSLGAVVRGDGTYRIVKIPAGTYTVIARMVGRQEVRKSVRISADEIVELNFVLREEALQTNEIVVTAERLVDNTRVGAMSNFSSEELTSLPRETVQATVVLTPGVLAAGTGFYIRGGRPTETELRIDNLDISDQFRGGTGSVGLSDYPITSSFGTEEVQVIRGGFAAEYGSLSGVVNVVIKTGREDRHEGYLRYRTEVPSLFGKAKNGIKAQGSGLQRIDFGFGGPWLPKDVLGQVGTFYISGWHEYERYRSNDLEVYDLAGNNLGQLPNNRRWVGNITGRVKLGLTKDINFIFGGQYGRTLLETMSWGWLYADDPGIGYRIGGGRVVLNLPEYVAKRPVANQYLSQIMARINHVLGESSFYELTFSWNYNRFEASKRKIYWDMEAQQWVIPSGALDPDFIRGFTIWEPVDQGFYGPDGQLYSANRTADGQILGDNIIDPFHLVRTVDWTGDLFQRLDVFVPSPLTGYIEGGSYALSNDNPYSLPAFFVENGNTRTFEFRWSSYYQVNGYYYNLLQTGDFKHQFKAGFEARFYELHRHYNSLPWDANPFFDVYTDEWGGNIYVKAASVDPDVAAKTYEVTSKPYRPWEVAFYVQDQILYKNIIITPGIRVDILNPNAKARNVLSPFPEIWRQVDDTYGWFKDATIKLQVSPRLYIAYPISDRSNFNVSYAMLFDRPPFNEFYDSFNTFVLRGNQIIGNPDIRPTKVKMYEAGYSNQLTDVFAIDIRAYYKDMYNLTGLSFVPAVPSPYSLVTAGEYGNARGIEVEIRKIPTSADHFGFRLAYTLSQAKGTASSTGSNYWLIIVGSRDPYTNTMRVFPLEEYTLSFDRPHRLDVALNFVWGNDEGPSIGGIYPLENTLISFLGFYQSGLPYTPLNARGDQAGDYLGARQPDTWRVDLRFERGFQLYEIFGDVFPKDARLTFFVDVINLFNRTEPVAVYARTGSPDYDGNNLNLRKGDFPAVAYYAEGDPANPLSISAFQYDRTGQRQYMASADLNGDGITTLDERYQLYQRFVQDYIARQVNYQFPRQVFVGFTVRF